MTDPTETALMTHFAALADPRIDRRKQHRLIDIVMIAILAVICGADGWTEVALFGQARQKWLQGFLALPNGIPSHDTFGRVFARINPQQFEACFRSWTAAVSSALELPLAAGSKTGEVITVDGKTLRGSLDTFLAQNPIHMVSAWSSAQHLVVGQVKVDAKSNEITAIPELLQLLDLQGCIVTIDAIGCQTEIAQALVKQGSDYLLAVKDNQPHLHEEVQELFAEAEETGYREVEHDFCKVATKGHGRLEIRRCWTISAPDYLAYLRNPGAWPHLASLVRFEYECHKGDQVATHSRYYISSLAGNAQQTLAAVQNHWRVENSLHWVLDVAFAEDRSRVRKDHAPENLSILRRIALNLTKQDQTIKVGVKSKRLKAGWDEDYLLQLLFGRI
jgi:predicted transposase YbfD/YdcC